LSFASSEAIKKEEHTMDTAQVKKLALAAAKRSDMYFAFALRHDDLNLCQEMYGNDLNEAIKCLEIAVRQAKAEGAEMPRLTTKTRRSLSDAGVITLL
jgi:hypothetical protein